MIDKNIRLKDGAFMPRLGMGTWYLGENFSRREQELEAIKAGLESGMRLIDTAEMYGNGASEQLIGQVVKEYGREKIFLVSKVLPQNAGRKNIRERIDHSLMFLRTDYLDLYLLHWRGSIPLEETVECMEELKAQGKILRWGVSNFDVDDMEELMQVPNGKNCAVDQVLYHLGSRGAEYALLPWLKERNIPLMAYCPLAQAGNLRNDLLNNRTLKQVAAKYGITVMQVLLLFVLHEDHVAAIPRSGRKEHILENCKVMGVELEDLDFKLIEKEYPAPKQKQPLDIV